MTDQEPSRRKLSDAERAAGMFIGASMQSPTSVYHQAVRIALDCKEQGHDPMTLRHALVADDGQMQRIVRAATNAHSRAEVDKPVARAGVERVAGGAFMQADRVVHASDRRLRGYLQRVPHGNNEYSASELSRLADTLPPLISSETKDRLRRLLPGSRSQIKPR